MKVGLFINMQFPEGFNLADRIPEMVAQVRSARDSGFAALWSRITGWPIRCRCCMLASPTGFEPVLPP